MREKFDNFKAALEALCREHKVLLWCDDFGYVLIGNLPDGYNPLVFDLLDETEGQ